MKSTINLHEIYKKPIFIAGYDMKYSEIKGCLSF